MAQYLDKAAFQCPDSSHIHYADVESSDVVVGIENIEDFEVFEDIADVENIGDIEDFEDVDIADEDEFAEAVDVH
jgi:hypothetical protein